MASTKTGWKITKKGGVEDVAGYHHYTETFTSDAAASGTASEAGSTFSLPKSQKNVVIMLESTLSGTSPSQDCDLQVSGNGVDWINIPNCDIIGTAITATADTIKVCDLDSNGAGPYYRLHFTLDVTNSDEKSVVKCHYWYSK